MELIVFDLDFTLWNAAGTWCDHTYPPFKKSGEAVLDSRGGRIALYPEVREILRLLHAQERSLAIASRTHEPAWALRLLELFGIDHYFSMCEIYPGSKTQHFQRLRNRTGVDYERMLFFDDEHRNVEEVSALGVCARLVEEGMTMQDLRSVLPETDLQSCDN